MSEKRFVLCKKGDAEYIEDNCCVQLYGFDVLCEMLNEQQATIEQLEKNFDDLTKWASEIAKRNVVLDEQNGQLQRENEQLRKEHQEMLEKYLLLKLKIGEVLNDE